MRILSPFAQIIPNGEEYIVYHSLFGKPIVLDKQAYQFIQNNLNSDIYLNQDEAAVIHLLEQTSIIVDSTQDERVLISKINSRNLKKLIRGELISFLSLIVTDCCNFKCSYCIGKPNIDKRKSAQSIMNLDTAKRGIDVFVNFIIRYHHPEAFVNFGGGEPLIGFDLIKKIVAYCHEVYPDVKFRFNINTNASLIDKEISLFFKKYNFEISSSLDGMVHYNDIVRRFKNGKGTFDKIISGFEVLKATDYPIDGFAVTITEKNLPGVNKRLINWATNYGLSNLRLDLDAVHLHNISPEKLAVKLVNLKIYARTKGIEISGFWERPFENMFPINSKGGNSFCGGKKGKSLCISSGGKVFICGYSGIEVGDIFDNSPIPNDRYINLIKSNFVGNNPYCLGCSIEGQCSGGCHIVQELPEKEGNVVRAFNCQLYKKATIELLKAYSRGLI